MLRTLLAEKPESTLVELREKLGLKVHLSSLWYRLQRNAWHKMQPMLDPARLVFVDETGLDTAMVRRYGWGECGQRVHRVCPRRGIGTRARSWPPYARGV